MSDSDLIATNKITLKRGESTVLSLRPYYYEDWVINGLTGTSEQQGRSFIFKLPFDIYIDPIVNTEFKTLDQQTGHEIIIYPPFASSPGFGEKSKNINVNYIPFIRGRLPPSHDKAGLDGFSLNNMGGIACDCIRLDIYFKDSDKKELPTFKVANDVLNRFLKLLRWYTNQWWVTKDRSPLESHLKYEFEINKQGERLSPFFSDAGSCGLLKVEKLLNDRLLNGVCYSLSINRRPPFHIELFMDALFFFYTNNIRHCIIEAAIACEALINDSLNNALSKRLISKSKKKRIVNDSRNLIKNYEDACNSFGHSFNNEDNKKYFVNIQQLWTARGCIAHGKKPIIKELSPGITRDVEKEDILRMIDALSVFIAWHNKTFDL